MSSTRIAVIAGVRPQYIKLAAFQQIVSAFNKNTRKSIELIKIDAGQHYDEKLAKSFIRELNIHFDFELSHSNLKPIHVFGNMIIGIYEVIESLNEKPDWVAVFGDSNPALAGAIAAMKIDIPIVHIDGGSSLGDVKTPEVLNAKLVDKLASVYFCRSKLAVEKLRSMDVTGHIFLTGDVTRDLITNYSQALPSGYGNYELGEYILTTIHRHENLVSDEILINICAALNKSGRKVLFIAHPTTYRKAQDLNLLGLENVEFINPLPFGQMLSAIKGCAYVVTDSGGLPADVYYLKKRCLLRSDMDYWPGLTQARIHRLIGTSYESIAHGLEWMEKELLAGGYEEVEDVDDNQGFETALEKLVELSKAVPRFKAVNYYGKLSFKTKVKENKLKLTAAEKQLHQETVKELTGRAKRLYMARVAQTLGRGGPSLLQRELGWSRDTIRKGSRELNRSDLL